MNDLIYKQAAIDAAIEAADDWDGGCSKERERFIRDALEELPSAQSEQRWIPCSERLPEERGFYLTTTKDKAVYCDYWNEDNFDRTEMVIAWMPLPEAYKEDDHETD